MTKKIIIFLIILIFLSFSIGFGLGYLIAFHNQPAPIIIEKKSD